MLASLNHFTDGINISTNPHTGIVIVFKILIVENGESILGITTNIFSMYGYIDFQILW